MSRDHPPRLGRGLAALLGERTMPAEPAFVILALEPSQLAPNPHQPREPIEPETLAELTASIRAQGVLQPILVRPHPLQRDRYEIVAGERRWRAAIEAGLSTIPCFVQGMTDDRAAAAALIENLQRVDLDSLEEAQGYARLQERFTLTQDDIADLVGKSRSHVANTLRLLKLPTSIRDLLRSGQLSAGHARALLTHPDPEGAARQVVVRNLSVRQTEALASAVSNSPSTVLPTGATEISPDLSEIETNLTDVLGMRVTIQSRDGRGRLAIRFSTLEQLDSLLQRLGQVGSVPF